MRTTSAGIIIFLCAVLLTGCRQKAPEQESNLINEEGMVSAEFFLVQDSVTYCWSIREIPGRSTLMIREGMLGTPLSSYEIYEPDRTLLLTKASELATLKNKEGYRSYSPEFYSHLIIQVDTAYWGDPEDIDRLVLVEDLINQVLVSTGNGKCTGSDLTGMVSFYAVVFDAEVARRSILKGFRENGIELPVVIAVEKGSDIRVIHPDNYQGDFSLI